jgi:allantoinase
VHAEDAALIDAAPAATGTRYADFVRSRPPEAENRAVRVVLEAAQASGGRVHVLHLSSADALPDLRAARTAGADVSAETCPHYLAFEAETVPDGATPYKCCPPIRDHDNQDRLWEALGAGDIDMVVSDHSPCTAELKRLDTGDFGAAWGGIASVQLALPVVWTTARARGYSLADVVQWMARAPADRVGLPGKGRIAPGADADLCVLAPDVEFTVDPGRLLHKNHVSAYAGRRLAGEIRHTWLSGHPVDLDGEPRGQLLQRGQQ